MIRRTIHNTFTAVGTSPALGMRCFLGWGRGVFAFAELPNYQPEQRDLDRAEQLI